MTRLTAALLAVLVGGLFFAGSRFGAVAQEAPQTEQLIPELRETRLRYMQYRASNPERWAYTFQAPGQVGARRLVETSHGLLQLDTTRGTATLLTRGTDGKLSRTSISAPRTPGVETWLLLNSTNAATAGTFEIASGDYGTLLHDTRNGTLWQLEQTAQGALAWASTDPSQPRPGDAHLGIATKTGEHGVGITRVHPRSPADIVGLQVGDKIVSIDGADLKSGDDFAQAMEGKKPGDMVKLAIARKAGSSTTTFTIEVALGEYK